MPVGAREGFGRVCSYIASVGAMSSSTSALHPLRVVQRQAVRDPRAAVVRGDRNRSKPERRHQRHHVGGHDALGVVAVRPVAGAACEESP